MSEARRIILFILIMMAVTLAYWDGYKLGQEFERLGFNKEPTKEPVEKKATITEWAPELKLAVPGVTYSIRSGCFRVNETGFVTSIPCEKQP